MQAPGPSSAAETAAEDVPFANTAAGHIFHFTYEGEPRPLHAYLLERYRWGRSADWAASFYPGRVRLNGAGVDAATWVRPGDRVTYLHLRSEEPPPPALGTPLHQDDWMLALHKPDTVPVNPVGVYYFTSLAIHAREVLGNPALTPMHRLDLETSGPLLFAREPRHLKRFHKLFMHKAMRKTYRALVRGRFPPERSAIAGWIGPAEGSRIHTRLALAEADPDEAAHSTDPTLSLTRIHAVHHRGGLSELELEPVTGKTNQLRVHLAHVGHPIVGDKKYHPEEGVFLDWLEHRDFERLRDALLLPRQALMCEALAFEHPFTGEPVAVHAPAGAWAAKVGALLEETASAEP